MKLELVDTHAHLDRYAADQRADMLDRAAAAGVMGIITVGFDLDCAAAGLAIAQQNDLVWSAVGIHPLAVPANGLSAELIAGLRSLAAGTAAATPPRLVAIGEIGLDSHAPAAQDIQEEALVLQLRLARESRLPVNLHVREWHDDLIAVLRREGIGRGAVVHYFQGDWPLARRYLELGCLISLGKPVTRPEATVLRDAARRIPLDSLLLETDTYPLPNRETEPKDVSAVAAAIGGLRRTTAAAIAAATTTNARRLFGLW